MVTCEDTAVVVKQGKPRANGKSLSCDDRESLVRIAVNILPTLSPYQAATAIMEASANYGSPKGVRITRRSAMHILGRGRARLRAEVSQIEPDFKDHTIWKARELYRDVQAAAKREPGKAYRYHRIMADLIKVDVMIGDGMNQSKQGDDDQVRAVTFSVVPCGCDDVESGTAQTA